MNSNHEQRLRLNTIALMLMCSIGATPLVHAQVVNPDDGSGSVDDNKENKNVSAPLNGYAEKLTPVHRAAKVSTRPYAPIKPLDDKTLIPEVEMFVGESRVFPAPNIGRIAVGNGKIMTAAAIDDKEVIVFANAVGTSSLFIWNKDGRYQRIKLNIVAGDTSRVAREIAAFLSGIPHSKASIVGDKVIVEGDNLSDADLAKIDQLEKRYPQIINFTNRVGWEQMVMMDVKVVEFPKNELRDIGLKWGATGGVAVGGIWGPGRRGTDGPYQINVQTGQDNQVPITNPSGSGGVVIPPGLNVLSVVNAGLNAQLNLLEQNGTASVLAEPQLSARNGSEAKFLAGGQFPYSVSTINGPTIQFKDYGIKLNITPKVDRNGVIRAKIKTEVSSIDSSVSSAAGPALLTREMETEFNVKSGETIVLSGMLQRSMSTDIDKVPFLGDLPILGALFRSKRFQNKETELVIFVTPTVIDSHSPALVKRVERVKERLQQNLGQEPYLSDPFMLGQDMSNPNLTSPSEKPAASEEKNDKQKNDEQKSTDVNDNKPVNAQPLSSADSASPATTTVAPVAETVRLPTLRARIDGLAVRQDPNISSQILLQLGRGAVVEALPVPGNGLPGQIRWTAVQVGEIKGWAASKWLEPGSAVPPKTTQSDVGRTEQSMVNYAANVGARTSVTANSAADTGLPRYRVNLNKLALHIAPDINAKTIGRLQAGEVVEALPQPPRGYWMAVKHGEQTGWVASQWIERE
jgi:pilus assembly protein CpaC